MSFFGTFTFSFLIWCAQPTYDPVWSFIWWIPSAVNLSKLFCSLIFFRSAPVSAWSLLAAIMFQTITKDE